MAQEHPLDNTQAEAHRVYNDMLEKHRDAFQMVRNHINPRKSWVALVKSSMLDDGPESAVDIHLENPPAPISSIRTKIRSLATGDLLKRLTEHLAPAVTKTPATPASTTILEPEIDPEEVGFSVPQNTLTTVDHNRRFNWTAFSRDLLIEVLKVDKEFKLVIHHKAPPHLYLAGKPSMELYEQNCS